MARHRVLGGIALAAMAAGAAMAQPAAPAQNHRQQGPDPKVMQVQVILDRLGFSPGVIDGRTGQTFKLAITGFQTANNITPSGEMDPATAQALQHYAKTPPTAKVTLTSADLAGPFVGPLPHSEDKQAKLQYLGYANPMEMLAERYHTTAPTLIALNSPDTKLVPGATITVPNVATSDHAYPADAKELWKQTLASLNVRAGEPSAAKIVVDKSAKSLSVYDDAGKLVAQAPVTTGSTHDPLPIGHWKILGIDTNPKFHFNPKLFWDASHKDKAAMLPPGPNGPVGIVWMDLSKPHYGLHGTPVPENIGRTASHGCVRMTNWDAGRIALMVKPGTPVIFQP